MSPRSPEARSPGASNVFSSNYQSHTQRADRSYYKKLYHFNADVELAEFSLPVMSNQQSPMAGRHMRTPSGVVNATKLPPLGAPSTLGPTREEPEEGQRPVHGGLEYDMLTGQARDMEDMGMDGEYGPE